MSLRSPLGRVLGSGSAKDGTSRWWAERLTSVALVPLIRLDKHEIETRRNKPKMVAATYCPWCGERYEDVTGRKVA